MNRIATGKTRILFKLISLSPFNSVFKCTLHTPFPVNNGYTKYDLMDYKIINNTCLYKKLCFEEHSGSVVDCLTQYNKKVAGSSPTGGTVLFP